MMWGYGYGGGWLMWLPLVFLLLVVTTGAIVLIVLLLQRDRHAGGQPSGRVVEDPARRILEERLARGEIDETRFRELLRTLDESRRPPEG